MLHQRLRIDFADSSCGNTLAEVTANCCSSLGFVARYSIQPDGEDQSGFDCVSFISEDLLLSNALGALGSDDSNWLGSANTAPMPPRTTTAAATDDNSYVPATTTNWGSDSGLVLLVARPPLGPRAVVVDCWALCDGGHGRGASLVAVDWNGASECYCQSACECLMDVGDSDGYWMTVDSITAADGRNQCRRRTTKMTATTVSTWCRRPARTATLWPAYAGLAHGQRRQRAAFGDAVDEVARNACGPAPRPASTSREHARDDIRHAHLPFRAERCRRAYIAPSSIYCDFVGWDWSECGDLFEYSVDALVALQSSNGGQYYLRCRATDDASMVAERAIHGAGCVEIGQ